VTLPKGWVTTAIDQIAEVRLGRQRSPKHARGEFLRPYLRAANVTWDGLDLSDVKTMNFAPHEQATYVLRPGDLLLAEASGSASEVGKPAIWTAEIGECYFQNTLIRVRPLKGTERFLLWQLRAAALNGQFIGRSRGVGIHHLGAERLSSFLILLAPLAEQRRIVAAIEEHLSCVDAGVEALERVRKELARYRASVLKAACEGRLVPTEAELARAENRPYEPASELLARILTERRARWPHKKKYAEPSPPDTSSLAALPNGWTWATLLMLGELKGGITKGQKRRTGDPVRRVPYLRVANVQRGWLDITEIKHIEATEDQVEELRLQPGDVLFNEGGDRDKLGRGWVWEGQLRECVHQNHVFRARLANGVHPKFLSWHGNTFGKFWFEENGKQTTNLASINLTKLGLLPVPLPPLAEQQRIVAEVERRLAIADGVAATVESALARAARLRQSILKRAFEGRLVPQDPNDEPASALLARIRQERERTEGARSKKSRVRGRDRTCHE